MTDPIDHPDPLDTLWEGVGERAIDKPAGLSSERPDHGARSLDSAIERARREFGWPDARLPHRLDRPTRGVLMIARDAAVAAWHAAEQREGRWTKWYVARIPRADRQGAPASALVGTHRAYLRREGRLARCVRSGGDPARLEVLGVFGAPDAGPADGRGHSHALIRLGTGRYHQIRAMLANLGFPLVGDRDYGAPDATGFELIAVALQIARPDASLVIRLPATRLPRRAGALDVVLESVLGAAPGPTS